MLKLIVSITFSLFLLQSTATASSSFFKGIDVSSYQGEINFKEFASSGYNHLYIKAGEGGTMVDPRFEENYKGAESEGLTYGFYYFLTAKNISEAESQAEHFANLITEIPYSLRPAMDFEVFSGITVEESNEIALAFLKKIEELTSVTPAIYSDAYAVETRWSSELSVYPLWVADYAHLTEPQTYTLPENSVWSVWSAYQYTDSAIIPGIDGNVDGDLFTSELMITKNTENSNAETTHTSTENTLLYTVKQGDTLWNISQTVYSSVAVLAQVNDISNVNLIYVGETLKIPKNTSYTVESGDTLTEIALTFHTTVDILSEMNQIQDSNLIFVGETLRIPT